LGRVKLSMKAKIPEIEKTLELVHVLEGKQAEGEALTTHYNLGRMIGTFLASSLYMYSSGFYHFLTMESFFTS